MTKDQIRAALDEYPTITDCASTTELLQRRGLWARKHGDLIARVLQSALDAQDNMVMVPREPTKEMILAGETAVTDNIDESQDSYQSYHIFTEHVIAYAAYKAMIAAAEEKQ